MMMDSVGETESFGLLQHGHKDMVQAVAYNSYGNRLAMGSADGKIKVYNRHNDGSWNACDTWGAHNGEILELHWLPPSIHPNLIASIAIDGKFKIWAEDPTVPPSSGRRFNSSSNRTVFELRSPRGAPYLSFSVRHNPDSRHTYIALLGRNGVVEVLENDEPENMTNWIPLDKFRVSDMPARSDEAAFKVAFDQNFEPSHAAIREGVPRDSLAIIVGGMTTATLWRTKEVSHAVSLGSNSSKEFYLAAQLPGHRGLVRDVAWAPGNARGFDICATVCRDGFIRVFEVRTPPKDGREARSVDYAKVPESQAVVSAHRSTDNGARNAPSGIGAGLAGVRSGLGGTRQQDAPGQVVHVVKEVAKLDTHRGPAWRVRFDEDGQMMATTGDDGRVRQWRREPSGHWCQSSDLAMHRG